MLQVIWFCKKKKRKKNYECKNGFKKKYRMRTFFSINFTKTNFHEVFFKNSYLLCNTWKEIQWIWNKKHDINNEPLRKRNQRFLIIWNSTMINTTSYSICTHILYVISILKQKSPSLYYYVKYIKYILPILSIVLVFWLFEFTYFFLFLSNLYWL